MQTNLVGYLNPSEVDQLRTQIAADGNGTLGILDQLVYQAPDGSLCPAKQYLNLCTRAGLAGVAGAVAGAAATVVLGVVGTVVTGPAMILGFMANGGDETVTLVVVNTTDDPLELVPETYVPWGGQLSEPVVKQGKDQAVVPPPNRATGHTSTCWIDSPVAAGMPKGSGAVGVWAFQETSIVGLSFAGAAGVVRLKNFNKDYELFVGGESAYRSIFTGDEKNSYAAEFRQGKNNGAAKDFYDRHIDGKAYKTGGSGDVLGKDKSIKVSVGGNTAKNEDLVVTAII